VPEIIKIGLFFAELLKNITGVARFLRHSIVTLEIDSTVAVDVSRFDHVLDFVVCERFAEVHHHVTQFSLADKPVNRYARSLVVAKQRTCRSGLALQS